MASTSAVPHRHGRGRDWGTSERHPSTNKSSNNNKPPARGRDPSVIGGAAPSSSSYNNNNNPYNYHDSTNKPQRGREPTMIMAPAENNPYITQSRMGSLPDTKPRGRDPSVIIIAGNDDDDDDYVAADLYSSEEESDHYDEEENEETNEEEQKTGSSPITDGGSEQQQVIQVAHHLMPNNIDSATTTEQEPMKTKFPDYTDLRPKHNNGPSPPPGATTPATDQGMDPPSNLYEDYQDTKYPAQDGAVVLPSSSSYSTDRPQDDTTMPTQQEPDDEGAAAVLMNEEPTSGTLSSHYVPDHYPADPIDEPIMHRPHHYHHPASPIQQQQQHHPHTIPQQSPLMYGQSLLKTSIDENSESIYEIDDGDADLAVPDIQSASVTGVWDTEQTHQGYKEVGRPSDAATYLNSIVDGGGNKNQSIVVTPFNNGMPIEPMEGTTTTAASRNIDPSAVASPFDDDGNDPSNAAPDTSRRHDTNGAPMGSPPKIASFDNKDPSAVLSPFDGSGEKDYGAEKDPSIVVSSFENGPPVHASRNLRKASAGKDQSIVISPFDNRAPIHTANEHGRDRVVDPSIAVSPFENGLEVTTKDDPRERASDQSIAVAPFENGITINTMAAGDGEGATSAVASPFNDGAPTPESGRHVSWSGNDEIHNSNDGTDPVEPTVPPTHPVSRRADSAELRRQRLAKALYGESAPPLTASSLPEAFPSTPESRQQTEMHGSRRPMLEPPSSSEPNSPVPNPKTSYSHEPKHAQQPSEHSSKRYQIPEELSTKPYAAAEATQMAKKTALHAPAHHDAHPEHKEPHSASRQSQKQVRANESIPNRRGAEASNNSPEQPVYDTVTRTETLPDGNIREITEKRILHPDGSYKVASRTSMMRSPASSTKVSGSYTPTSDAHKPPFKHGGDAAKPPQRPARTVTWPLPSQAALLPAEQATQQPAKAVARPPPKHAGKPLAKAVSRPAVQKETYTLVLHRKVHRLGRISRSMYVFLNSKKVGVLENDKVPCTINGEVGDEITIRLSLSPGLSFRVVQGGDLVMRVKVDSRKGFGVEPCKSNNPDVYAYKFDDWDRPPWNPAAKAQFDIGLEEALGF